MNVKIVCLGNLTTIRIKIISKLFIDGDADLSFKQWLALKRRKSFAKIKNSEMFRPMSVSEERLQIFFDAVLAI